LDLSKLFRMVIGTGVCRGITAAGTFALNLCLAWQLSLDDCGRIVLCLTATIALAIISRFGFDVSLLKFAGAAWHTQDTVTFTRTSRNALLVVAMISSTVMILGQGVLWMVGPERWHATTIMQTLLWALPFLSMCYVVSATFKAAHRPETGALFELGGASLMATLGIVVYATWKGEITPEIAATIFTLVAMVFCLFGIFLMRKLLWSPTAIPREDTKEAPGEEPADNPGQPIRLKQQVRTSADFALIAYTHLLGQWGGLLLVEYWGSAAEVAVFSAAMRVVLMPSLILNCILAVCSPRISGLHQSQDFTGMRLLVKRSALLLFFANFPILLAIALGAPWLMACFGPEYQPYGYLLSILACGQFLGTMTGMGSAALGMAGYHGIIKWIGLIVAVGSFTLTGLLVSHLGVLGAAIGGAVYTILLSLSVAIATKVHLGFFPTPAIPKIFGVAEGTVDSQLNLEK